MNINEIKYIYEHTSIYDYIESETLMNVDYSKLSQKMLVDMIIKMCINHSDYTFYCHNLSKFDGIYIIGAICSSLNKNIKIKILSNNSNIIKISIISELSFIVHPACCRSNLLCRSYLDY